MKLRRVRIISTIVLIGVLSSLIITAAGVPRSEKEIPIYPGAVRDTNAEKEILNLNSEYDLEYQNTQRSFTIRAYTTKTIIDEVCRFYINQLKAKPGVPVDDPYSLKPGAVYPPWYELNFYEAEIFEDQHERDMLIRDGKWIRSAFAKRPQWQKGVWLRQACFEWNIVLNNGDLARYSVSLEDVGYDSQKKVDFKSTRINIEILVTKSEAALDEEEDEAMDEDVAAKTRQLTKNPPTPQSLGIPIYPGAVFNPEISAGMSLDDDYQCFVYLSNDPPAKVVAFYEQRLGKKADSNEGGYLIALKGKLPVPEEGLAIQPNLLFGGTAKTVITVQKKTE
ncbi:MAG: hypothetical protein GXY86_00700 [Firmicutes bacterium]|nr:hypothetical protein [Bacillota bacterium]